MKQSHTWVFPWEKWNYRDLWASAHGNIIHNRQKLETTQSPSTSKWANCDMFTQRNAIRQQKGTGYGEMCSRSWISEALGWMEEVRHKRPPGVWFHLRDILESQVYGNRNQASGHQGLRGKKEGMEKRYKKKLLKVMELLYRCCFCWFFLFVLRERKRERAGA